MMKRLLYIGLCLLLAACDRDIEEQTASLTVTNMTDTGTTPMSIWSVYITPTNSATRAIDRSIDLLASAALDAGSSRAFTIDTCGQLIDVQLIFSNGSEQSFSSIAAVNCDSSYTCIVDDLAVLSCS